jgi:hypothetical protein
MNLIRPRSAEPSIFWNARSPRDPALLWQSIPFGFGWLQREPDQHPTKSLHGKAQPCFFHPVP